MCVFGGFLLNSSLCLPDKLSRRFLTAQSAGVRGFLNVSVQSEGRPG